MANQNDWNHASYNLISHNCNNFTDFCSKYLLNNGIPADIIELPYKVLNTPLGKQILMPQLQQMQQQTNNMGNSMFGGMGANGHGNQNMSQPAQIDPIESSEE